MDLDARLPASANAPDGVHVRAQGGDVQSLHERGVTWVSFKPMRDVDSRIDFALRKYPEIGLLSGTVQGVRHEHAHRDSGDGDDDFSFHINVSGRSLVTGRRVETTLCDGDAMLLSYSVGRTISRADVVDHRVIRVPRAALAPCVPDIDHAVLRAIPRGTGMLALLRSYVDAVFDDPVLTQPLPRKLVAAQVCDLIAMTLGATRDARAIAQARGIRAARLTAIKEDVEANLATGDVSPSAIAKRHGISDSYIRKLFESEGTSLSQFVLERRLALAHRMLANPASAARTIASIAFDAGFSDLSYFNRTFRRRYGLTPSDVREVAR
jgi:AraC-like DNA-binding protein